VALLALFDTFLPRRPTAARRLRRRIRRELGNLARLSPGMALGYLASKFARMARRITARMARCVGLERPIDRALRNVVEAHVRAAVTYVPKPFSGPMMLFVSPDVPVPDRVIRPEVSWRRLVPSGLTVRKIPGDLGAIVEEPRVRLLAAELRACLDAVDAGTARGGS
jgi:thioesterase domain-containing protein